MKAKKEIVVAHESHDDGLSRIIEWENGGNKIEDTHLGDECYEPFILRNKWD